MAASRPAWLADLSRSFKRHRHGRPGWFIEVHRDRLRVRSSELPQRPDVGGARMQSVTLRTAPGPSTAATALSEACDLFDQVETGTWRWPEAGAIPDATEAHRLTADVLDRLTVRLHERLVGEQVTERTWERMYKPYYSRLLDQAAQTHWGEDHDLLAATLRQWESNSRARQMAHDRLGRCGGRPAGLGLRKPRRSVALVAPRQTRKG